MQAKPIIFNGDMVRAILDGRKTQTRRVIKIQPPTDKHQLLHVMDSTDRRQIGKSHWAVLNADKTNVIESDKRYFSCPYGQAGDLLWVRETFMGPLIDEEGGDYPNGYWRPEFCEYRADGGRAPEWVDADGEEHQGWKPSIHMPRWASRITLEITGVRVERLQDISEEDAQAEGIERVGSDTAWKEYARSGIYLSNPVDSFKSLWDSIYGTWDANPWAWVIEFKPHLKMRR